MQKLVLVDGHSILNRAFFGMPDLTNQKGEHVGAVAGFLNIFLKLISDETPDYLAVAFDLSAPTFRHERYKEYKGTRKPMDPALKSQVPLIKALLQKMNVCVVTAEGYEADDILGTLAFQADREGMDVIIMSGDKDLFQLAGDHICIRIPRTKKGETSVEDFYAGDVKRVYSVTPKEFIDVKALMGDQSDNIPGVMGIGEKTAIKIIAEHHSIEEAIKHVDEGRPTKVMTNFKKQYESAVFSKWLATIKTDVPLNIATEDLRKQDIFTQTAADALSELGLKKLSEKFAANMKCGNDAPAKSVEIRGHELKNKAEILSLISALGTDIAFYIAYPENRAAVSVCDLFGEEINSFYADDDILKAFGKKLLQTDGLYYTFDLKRQLPFLFDGSIDPSMRKKFADLSIAAYLINPLPGEYPYDAIASEYVSLHFSPVGGARSGCAAVAAAVHVREKLMDSLEFLGMKNLFFDIEMPLVFVLSDMERAGIYTDREELKKLSDNFDIDVKRLEKEIYELCGEEFNINSPKQLGEILFEKLSLPHGKKTRTGYSTAADVLEKLSRDYPVVSKILEYRTVSKLKSTYADGLKDYIDEKGLIHTSFNQTITATGRLSSTEPNLQNIPIRMELGQEIRKAFTAREGCVFLDADYSQIELRLLAALSDDKNLIEAYYSDADIHRITASKVFNTPLEEVTPQQRRNAKAVNFGIVYGISSFGLSQGLSITRSQANEYIKQYFETYPQVKEYLDRTVREAKLNGYTVTMFKRRRPIPELSSSNFMLRQFGERAAMNSPIQGSAADIIKIAMINVEKALLKAGLKAKIVLQVHDELLVEAPLDEAEKVKQILHDEMKNAVKLSVPLEVEVQEGKDWFEAH